MERKQQESAAASERRKPKVEFEIDIRKAKKQLVDALRKAFK